MWDTCRGHLQVHVGYMQVHVGHTQVRVGHMQVPVGYMQVQMGRMQVHVRMPADQCGMHAGDATCDLCCYRVTRGAGSLGTVSLQWTLYSIVGGVRTSANGDDITPVSGILTFNPGVRLLPLSLTVVNDDLPELGEEFEVEFRISTVQSAPLIGARLDNDSVSMVTVLPSDDPYGVLSISSSTSMLSVAEDIPPEDPSVGVATVDVVRSGGSIGTVQALWEVWPEGVESLPSYVDLLLYGVLGGGVRSATPRPSTNTSAITFTGQLDSIVRVPGDYQPTNVSNGFTVRYWVCTCT